MTDDPVGVEIEMAPRPVPKSKIEDWRSEWDELDDVSRSMYESKQAFLDGKALEFVQRMFTQAGREADHHYWVERWEVVYDDG